MKKLLTVLFLTTFIFSACKKESPDSNKSVSTTTEKPAEVIKTPDPSPDPTPEPLSAKFSITVPDPQNIFENQAIQFNSLGKNIVSWVWIFGNGTKQFTANPVASYNMHGYYNVTLIVTDKNGNTATSTQQILILCNFLGH